MRLLSLATAIVWLAAFAPSAGASPRDSGISPGELGPGIAKFRRFAAEDGLTNLVVTSIGQDASGLLWIGTDDGAYRYDGERFTHFSVADGLTSALVDSIAPGPGGRICVGAHTGIACWNGTRFSQASARGIPATAIPAMVNFGDRLWVGTDIGLYVQSGDSFAPAPGWPRSPVTPVVTLWADATGVVASDGRRVKLSSGDGAWRDLGDMGLGGARIQSVLRDRQGALWIRSWGGMWIVEPGASRARDIHAGLPASFNEIGPSNALAIGPRGDVLVATDVGFAYREGTHWRIVAPAEGTAVAPLRTLFVDREGSVWIGSAGLYQLRGRGLLERYDATSGLPSDVVWTFARDPQGALWAGTNRCLARAADGRWRCVPGTEGRTVRSIVFPPRGGMFYAGAPAELIYIAPDGERTVVAGFDHGSNTVILALELGPDGALWIATSEGLYRLPGAVPGEPQRVVIPGARPDERFSALAVAGSLLWTTTAEGAAVLDHGTWHLFGTSSGLLASALRYVLVRADGRVCITYHEPIGASCFRYDGRQIGQISQIEHLTPSEGLVSGMIYLLGEDAQGRMWIGSGAGIDIVTPRGIDHFDEADGLAGNDSAAMAFLADRDGSLWLGATGGATHVYAQHYAGPPSPPATAIVAGRIGARALGAPCAPLELAHDPGALTLDLASSSLLDPRRVGYQIRLSPLETEWSAIDHHQARYPALPPAEYRFEVRSRIGAGDWGPITAMTFRVAPAWWQSPWFVAAAGLTALCGFGVALRAWLRRRTRQLNAQSESSFRMVLDQIPDLVAVYRDRVLSYLNTTSQRFLGLAAPTTGWSSVDLFGLVHPDDRVIARQLITQVGGLASQEVTDVVEVRIRSAEGAWRICEASAILVEVSGVRTLIARGRDVTERKRLRAKLLVTDRMASLGTLAAGIAHEINNPLAYVSGNLEAVAESLHTVAEAGGAVTAEHAEMTAAISDAQDGAERVRKIVQGLRLFSRSEEEKRMPLELSGVIEAAIRMTSNEVRHRAQLVRELGPVPRVVGDDGRLTQVFINLLVNAAHAIPAGHSDQHRITVRTRRDEQGRAVVEVEDTGSGIPPEIMSRVFDPFFTTKDVGEGTGLGLSICHGIVSGLGGQIAIENGPERGTIVRVVLPAEEIPAAPPPGAPSDPGTAQAAPRRHRVLVVDDEPQVATTMQRLLRRDYDVTIAHCGQDALAHVTAGTTFDAILSDVMMPNMTGIELYEELSRIAPAQAKRLIFVSGGAFTAQTRTRLDELGVLQLEKPTSAKDLRAAVLSIAAANAAPERESR